jgi:hypothetical protein
LFYTLHQRLAEIPRADGDRRRDDRKHASAQKPAPRRAGNDKNVDASPSRSVFVSLPAWLIDCLCCPVAEGGSRGRRCGRWPELRWHGLLYFV